MSPSPDVAEAAPLPDDVATLKALLLGERAAAAKLSGQNEHLRAIIKELQRALFGRRSEKVGHPDQLELALEDLEQALAEGEAEAEQVRVIVTRRPKYGCRACESAVVQAPAPARLIEGGLSTETLVAHVLVGKHADHLPLYRQCQIYARQGIELDRSTLADWVGRAAAELRPVHEQLFEHLKRSPKLFMDETRAPVLDPGRKRTKSGYLWAIARDDRPWGGTDPP